MTRPHSGMLLPIHPSSTEHRQETFAAPMDLVSNQCSRANVSYSVNSIDEMLAGEDTETSPVVWKTELGEKIEEILDRKRSSVQGRESTLAAYIRILTSRYAEEDIRGKETELVASFLKSIKLQTSEKEAILAIKGT